MSLSKVRVIIALMIIGVFVLISGFLAIFPLLTKQNVQLSDYSDFVVKTSGVYTGIIGVIIGYYFGRTQDLDAKETKKTSSAS
jgi:uncharacterized membrane protein HdeD (DUF308 family)